jgi:hypothetical protein
MQDRLVFHSSELFYFLFCFGHVISHTIQSAPPKAGFRVLSVVGSEHSVLHTASNLSISRARSGRLVQVVDRQVFLVALGTANHIHVDSPHLSPQRQGLGLRSVLFQISVIHLS